MPKPPRLTPEGEAARCAEAVELEGRLAGLGRDQAVAHRRLLQTLLDLQRVEAELGRGDFTAVGASMVLAVTEHRAQALMAEARRLAELDRGFELFDAMTAEQVRALLDAVADLDVELADRVVDVVRDRVAATGAGLGRRWISDAARRARQRIAPKDEDKRRRRAAAGRKVTAHALDDGQAALWIEGPQAAITAMQVAIRDRVAADGGDWFPWEDRSLDARRFDAAVALLTGNRSCTCPTQATLWTEVPGADLTDPTDATGTRPADATGTNVAGAGAGAGGGGGAASAGAAGPVQCGGRGAQPGAGCCSGHGARPESADLPVVTILIPLATALGQSDEPATRLPSQREIPGGLHLAGPIGAIEARELLRADVLIRALAVDPVTGQPTGQPSPTVRPHQPDPPPRRAVRRRDATSRGAPASTDAPWARTRRAPRPPLGDAELRAVLDGLQCWAQTSPLTRPASEVPGYRMPVGMQREVRARAVTCEFPGCRVPAQRCDLDHDIPWPLGPTVGWNLGPLCRRHHRVKQTGWTKTRHPNGSLTWTSPTGRTFQRPSWHSTPDTAVATTAAGDGAGGLSEQQRPGDVQVAEADMAGTTGTPGTAMPEALEAPVARVVDDPWDTTPENVGAFDPIADDPWSGTPAVDPAQLVDPLTIPTPDDPDPDDRWTHGRADLPRDNNWAWIDDTTHDLPHPVELATEPPGDWATTA